jgi:hypothetical protein
MNPSRSRERKCLTCKHYQPSPLWRKGWCRNPLLYDRNTNHLVEADSLACNRTFIDYWEPISGPTPAPGPAARSTKPRIAPSVAITKFDSKGEREVVTGNTPAGGMAAVGDAAASSASSPVQPYRPAPSKKVPQLSIVTPDYEPAEGEDLSKETRQLEQVPGGAAAASAAAGAAAKPKGYNAMERIRRARRLQRGPFGFFTGRLRMVLILLVVLAVLAALGSYYYTRHNPKAPLVLAVPTVTVPAPTPTGFGDNTPTPKPPLSSPTVKAPPPNVIGVNGWVQTTAGLRVRSDASLASSTVYIMPSGTKAHVVDGPKQADGVTWWKLDQFNPNNKSMSGWSSQTFLQPSSGP